MNSQELLNTLIGDRNVSVKQRGYGVEKDDQNRTIRTFDSITGITESTTTYHPNGGVDEHRRYTHVGELYSIANSDANGILIRYSTMLPDGTEMVGHYTQREGNVRTHYSNGDTYSYDDYEIVKIDTFDDEDRIIKIEDPNFDTTEYRFPDEDIRITHDAFDGIGYPFIRVESLIDHHRVTTTYTRQS